MVIGAAATERRIVASSSETAPSPDEAAGAVADFGFLVRSDLPDRPGPAVLLIALRDRPAKTHYDPDVVEYWVTRDGRGRREQLTRTTPLPIDDRAFDWGLIRVVDRLGVTNEYLTFGGRLSAAAIEGVSVAVFESPVPLLRRGGHSQGWDDAAENVGAFFGRALVAVDYVPGFEGRLGDARPEARYAAFVVDLAARYRAGTALREAQPHLWSLISAEERRMARTHPDDVRAGRHLLDEMLRA